MTLRELKKTSQKGFLKKREEIILEHSSVYRIMRRLGMPIKIIDNHQMQGAYMQLHPKQAEIVLAKLDETQEDNVILEEFYDDDGSIDDESES